MQFIGEVEILRKCIVVKIDMGPEYGGFEGAGTARYDQQEAEARLRRLMHVLADGILYLPVRGDVIVRHTLYVSRHRGNTLVFLEIMFDAFDEMAVQQRVSVGRDEHIGIDALKPQLLRIALVTGGQRRSNDLDLLPVRPEDVAGFVDAPIIYDDDLIRRAGLGQAGVNARGNHLFLVMARDEDADG